MTTLSKLLDPYSRVPDHLSPGPMQTPSQAYEDIPLTPEQASIRSQLAALDELLDRPAAPSLADLVANTPPAKLAARVAEASQAQTQAEWLSREAGKLRAALTHARLTANAQPEVFDVTRAHLAEQIEQNVTGLLISAKEFGSDLLGKTDKLLAQDAVLVQRVKTAVVQLTSLTRVRVAGQISGDHLRTVALFADLDDSVAQAGDQGTLALAGAATKKGTGVLLAALALDLLPGLTLSVAPDWETVQQRREKLDVLRETLAQDQPVATIADHRLSLDSSGVSNF
ncbi:hypothetical protein [Corynebacterium comes]|uniref:Uncharacterized protein n=1 Tax=Corynebacterium comes TaxID=2675218 RepID=A0A6B8W5C5_9CORY|nr:hypothetical protein [Corynebacterium comes]QGU05100.1 hypothetical protein CETAM_09235 [Corynebacterium comes]